MAENLRPVSAEQVRETIAWAGAERRPLSLVGGGSKRGLGRPSNTDYTLDLSALSGITLYEPEELVMTAGAGTPLSEVEAALDANAQQLAFEPPDFGPLYGAAASTATIGGVVACNLAGPRRPKAGAARDHLLGFKGVSGRAERFKSGGRVVKNVTGYDLSKLLAGSYGTLAALCEVTLKVLPAPKETRTVVVFALDEPGAVTAMAAALNSPNDVSGAAHLPPAVASGSAVGAVSGAGTAVTAFRIEGFSRSVQLRGDRLGAMVADLGEIALLAEADSKALWREIRDVAPLLRGAERCLWRLSVAPADGPRVAAAVAATLDARAYYDWGGGLVWLTVPAGEDGGDAHVRAALAATGGHATLVRAPDSIRASVPVFQPQPEPLARLTARVKEGFDPLGILNPGRMYAGV